MCARRKLETEQFNLVVHGQFKRGKSTLINALLGTDLLPTAVVPLTPIVTIIQPGPQDVELLARLRAPGCPVCAPIHEERRSYFSGCATKITPIQA